MNDCTYKELNNYFPNMLEGNGIFTAIASVGWFPCIDPSALDTYFAMKHGEKLASRILKKFANEDGIIEGDPLKRLAYVLYNTHKTQWSHYYEDFAYQYNAIENTDYTETIKDTTGNTRVIDSDTTTGSNSQTRSNTTTETTNDNSVYAFDSVAPVNASKSESDSSVHDTNVLTDGSFIDMLGSGSEDSTITDNGTYEREYRKHGNIGVVDPATMLKNDITFWNNNQFADLLCSDVCKLIALSIY